MEKNKKFIKSLSLINNEILSNNTKEQSGGIEKLNNLINNRKNKNKRLDKEKLTIQEIFDISVINNFVGIFKYIMNNYRNKININKKIKSEEKQTLISIACKKEEDEIFNYLLSDNEIDLNESGFFNATPFVLACEVGRLDYVELILKKAKEIDINIGNGKALYNACLSGNPKLVECLLSFNNIKIDLKNSIGNTIFMSACMNKNKDYKCAKLLYDEYKNKNIEFNINAENKDNHNAIYLACENGNIDLVRYLLSISDIDNIKNLKFFSIACYSGNIKLVQLLYNRFYDKIDDLLINESFNAAIGSNNTKLVKYLLSIPDFKSKIDINYQKFMHFFIDIFSNSNLEMVELLYDKYGKEIDINLTVCDGCSVLYEACSNSKSEMLKFLLSKQWKKNIDININNEKGETPFINACKRGYFDIAKILYERKDFDKEKNKFDNNKKTDWIECYERNIVLFDKTKGLTDNQTRTFRGYKKKKNKNIIIDTVYNVKDINKTKVLYQIEYNKFGVNGYLKIITYSIGNKTFTATVNTIKKNSNIKNIEFNFEGLKGLTSEQFEEEINKILNSFEKVDSFDTYTSWLPLALIEFKKQEKQKNQNKIIDDDEIDYFYIYHGINDIRKIIDNNLKNKEDKILVCDFAFSPVELEIENNAGHAIPLVIFNSNDNNGNPKTKILAFNTGFKSEKAFEKFKKELGDDVEIIKIDKDLIQKYGSCNISPKPMVEALFASFMNELKEDESLIDKLEQYSQDMIIVNRLAKLRDESSIINRLKNKIFNIVSILNGLIKTTENNANESYDTNNTNLEDKDTTNLNNTNNTKETINEEKVETREEILGNINLEEYLERLKKYKKINERLAENYKKLYKNSKNWLSSERSLNKNLDGTIKDINEVVEKNEMEKDFKNDLIDYIY